MCFSTAERSFVTSIQLNSCPRPVDLSEGLLISCFEPVFLQYYALTDDLIMARLPAAEFEAILSRAVVLHILSAGA
jgi:hypothetical protein